MTSYYEDTDRSDLSLAYGIHLHDPRLLEYVGEPESARLLSHSPEYWLHHMGRDRTMSAALQLQHDSGLILSNLQVLGQFVSSLNRMSSEVMRMAFAHKPFPTEVVCGAVSPSAMGGALHGCHGTLASIVYAGDSGTSAVFSVQRVHDMFGLLSLTFRSRENRGVVDIVFCRHQLLHHQTSAHETFVMSLCDYVHYGDVIGSFV